MTDCIHIERLTVDTQLGVPDEERARPQRIEISATFPVATVSAAAAGDDLSLTINYFQVCQTLRRAATSQPRKLLETLAEDLCDAVLAEFPAIDSICLELRKFIIPDTQFISLKIQRDRRSASLA